jgi:hypothetical protein
VLMHSLSISWQAIVLPMSLLVLLLLLQVP